MPESFKVLIRELRSLALDVRVLDEDGNEITLKDSSAEEMENVKNVAPDDVGESVKESNMEGFFLEDENGDAVEDEEEDEDEFDDSGFFDDDKDSDGYDD